MLSDGRQRIRTCQKQGLHYICHSMQAELQVLVSFPLPQVPWGHMAGWGGVQVDTVRVDLCYVWKCELGESMAFKVNMLFSWRRCYFSPQGCLLWIPPWGTGWVKSEEQSEHQSWHPVWLSGVLRTDGRLPLPTRRNSRQIILQTICVCCNMHKLHAHEFVVSKHCYSLFWANRNLRLCLTKKRESQINGTAALQRSIFNSWSNVVSISLLCIPARGSSGCAGTVWRWGLFHYFIYYHVHVRKLTLLCWSVAAFWFCWSSVFLHLPHPLPTPHL